MSIHLLLQKYLYLQYQLDLPEIGSIHIQEISPTINPDNILEPPKVNIEFLQKASVITKKQFILFLMNQWKVDELVAIKKWNDFLFDFKTNLQQNKSYELMGIGNFFQTEKEQILFKADPLQLVPLPFFQLPHKKMIDPANASLVAPFNALVADETSETDLSTEESFQRVDDWKKIAFLLLIAGLLAIIFHYLQ